MLGEFHQDVVVTLRALNKNPNRATQKMNTPLHDTLDDPPENRVTKTLLYMYLHKSITTLQNINTTSLIFVPQNPTLPY